MQKIHIFLMRFSLLIAVEQQGILESKCKYGTTGLEYFCKLDWKCKYNKKISLRFGAKY